MRPSIPVLAAATSRSPSTASSSAATNSGATSATACTPRVLCAVSAVITVAPYTSKAANVFRSAWMPAPPPVSEPAIVRATGGRLRLACLLLQPAVMDARVGEAALQRVLGRRAAADGTECLRLARGADGEIRLVAVALQRRVDPDLVG